MGYTIYMRQADFFIAGERHASALETIKNLDPADFYPETTDPHFAFVETSSYQNANILQEALESWRWSADLDEVGNIISIEFIGEKLGDEVVLFDAIAPFVREGSNIEMVGEDGRVWRWFFSKGSMEEQEGKVTYISSTNWRNK